MTNLNGRKYLSASSFAASWKGSGRTEEMLTLSLESDGVSAPISSWISFRAASQEAFSWALWDLLVSLSARILLRAARMNMTAVWLLFGVDITEVLLDILVCLDTNISF